MPQISLPNMPQLVGRGDLTGLDINGRKCEVCDKHMHDHDWAIINSDGFVIDCSMNPEHYKTPEEWAKHEGVEIMDPDGWRMKDAPSIYEPTTRGDFMSRMMISTIRGL